MGDPEAIARDVIAGNRYMTLGTIDPDGRPRLSPVYYSPDRYTDFYWVSPPEAQHSRNIAERPDVHIVIYDSSARIGTAQAVYLTARAAQVPDDELADCIDVAFEQRFPEVRRFEPERLSPPAPLRLYRARVTEHEIHIRGSDPTYGRGVDYRMSVTLP